jgi:HD-GYP domain-containing protein (c-di-GMP phosphodiesterase class II)
VWGKPGRLSRSEWEQVRLHAYVGESILAPASCLSQIRRVATMHHERLDGSGYFRGSRLAEIPGLARIVAAADVFHAMSEPRPHRPPVPRGQAKQELLAEVKEGRLDGEAVAVVLQAAGDPARRRLQHVGGLTAREVEVLRVVVRGLSKAEIARALGIAPKTADAHLQHIYAKIGVSSRAAAALFAMQHGLADSLLIES